jgi:NAD(P)-dependent dehydrogenase (short-subunit alcohol dehydrogenase family)
MAVDTSPLSPPAPVRLPGTVIVTGGASGLGRATADAVATAGGRPIVVDQVPVEGFDNLCLDLSDCDATHEAVTALIAREPIDGIVTAAGIDTPGALLDVDRRDWERVVAVNLLGTVSVVRAALPALVERRGRVVLVASTLAHRGVGDATAYCASKFGVMGFGRALTAELKGQVGVTLLTPGGMRTAFFDGRAEQYRPGPDAQLCDPADVAAAIVFALCSPPGCEVKELVVAHPHESSWP